MGEPKVVLVANFRLPNRGAARRIPSVAGPRDRPGRTGIPPSGIAKGCGLAGMRSDLDQHARVDRYTNPDKGEALLLQQAEAVREIETAVHSKETGDRSAIGYSAAESQPARLCHSRPRRLWRSGRRILLRIVRVRPVLRVPVPAVCYRSRLLLPFAADRRGAVQLVSRRQGDRPDLGGVHAVPQPMLRGAIEALPSTWLRFFVIVVSFMVNCLLSHRR